MISGNTRLLGVFGSPISHSQSPKMYNFCFNYYGIDWVYLAFESTVEETKDSIDAIKRLKMRGANVTMPCKQEMAKYMDHLSPAAEFVGAVNTIVNEDGVLTGHITDGMGLVLDLKDHGVSVEGKNIVLLGAGGAATAIMVQLCLCGAKSISVFNRGEEALNKVRSIAKRMKSESQSEMSFYSTEDKDSLKNKILGADILINGTSLGMAPMNIGKSVVDDLSVFHKDLVVYECVYNPQVTKLMEDALAAGVPREQVIGGKGMLLWQGAEAFKIFTGKDMPVSELKAYLENNP